MNLPDFEPPLKTFFTVPTGYDAQARQRDGALAGLEVYCVARDRELEAFDLVCGMESGVIYRISVERGVGAPLTYFKAQDRYRDLAVAPDGRRIYGVTAMVGRTVTLPARPTATLAHPGSLLEFTYTGTPTRSSP